MLIYFLTMALKNVIFTKYNDWKVVHWKFSASRRFCSAENNDSVYASFVEDPEICIKQHSEEVSETIKWRILI